MAFRILCDEHTDKQVAVQLRKLGHDVERVVNVPALGTASADEEIMAYARRTDRLILTADDDFLVDPSNHAGVLYLTSNRFEPFTVASIVDVVDEQFDQEEIEREVYLSTDWL